MYLQLQITETKLLIVDLKGVSYIDLYSARMLALLYADYESVGIKLILTGVSGNSFIDLKLIFDEK